MLAILIEKFCYKTKVDQLKLIHLLILYIITIIADADVVRLEVIVDVANVVKSLN